LSCGVSADCHKIAVLVCHGDSHEMGKVRKRVFGLVPVLLDNG